MFYYNAFGLIISSDMQLKPLTQSAKAVDVDVDVEVILTTVNKNGIENPDVTTPFYQQSKNQHWFYVPDIAYFYIVNGNKIYVEPFENSDLQSVELFVLGTCMGIIFHMRNLLVIHGNAVRINDKAIIFAGKSGQGKSSLAATFHQNGYDILADDLAVIDKNGLCYPSYPQLKLWHDTATKLEIDTEHLKRIRPQVNKYALPLTTGFYHKPLPVAGVYILNSHNQDNYKFEQLDGIKKIPPLKANTYRYRQIKGLGLTTQHLQACTTLAQNTKIIRVTRPQKGLALNKLLKEVTKDINQSCLTQ